VGWFTRRKSSGISGSLLSGIAEGFRLFPIRGLNIVFGGIVRGSFGIASRIASFLRGMFQTFSDCSEKLQSLRLKSSTPGIAGSKSDSFTNPSSDTFSPQRPISLPWKFVDGSIRTQVSLKHSIIARKEEFLVVLRTDSGFMFLIPRERGRV